MSSNYARNRSNVLLFDFKVKDIRDKVKNKTDSRCWKNFLVCFIFVYVKNMAETMKRIRLDVN